MSENNDRRLLRILLGALIFVLGAQSMRFLFASITWYLRDTLLIGTYTLIPIALGPFVAGAIFPVLSRWIGARRALFGAVSLLALARVVNQVSASPQVDFWTAAIATLAFVGCLPLLFGLGRETLVGGVLVGLALDSAIKGLSLSLDLSYQPGLLPLLVVVTMAGATLYLAMSAGPVERRGVGWGSGVSLVAIAPFLFLQLLLFQNQGWTSQMTGMSSAGSAVRIALLNAATLVVVGRFYPKRWLVWPSIAVVAGAVFVAEGNSLTYNILSLFAIPAAGLVWAQIVPDPDRQRVDASGFYLTTGMTVFVISGLAYYLPLDLSLPFDSADVRVAFAVLLVLFTAGSALRSTPRSAPSGDGAWLLAAGAAFLPLFALVVVTLSQPVKGDPGDPVRYMTYNLHSAFNTSGSMDVEAIARVIEDSGATVVGLQEVDRGRLLSANTDLLFLLQNRLGFEHVAFFGTTDPTWGNAILSRFPLSEVETRYLPLVGTPLRRGYLGATVHVGDREILFISIHLQHINDPDVHDQDPEGDLYPVHHQQIATILDTWNGREPAILVGDFNARPTWAQIEELVNAGWVDSWGEAGSGDGFTSNAADPQYRIDYVFHTPDLTAVDVGVIPSLASDHFAVVADISG